MVLARSLQTMMFKFEELKLYTKNIPGEIPLHPIPPPINIRKSNYDRCMAICQYLL